MLVYKRRIGEHSMSTGLSTEERLQIIHEVYLVIAHSSRVVCANSPKVDAFWLVRAILEDTVIPCTTKQALYSVLRKSPVWGKIRPFLKYNNTNCGRKGCQCYEFEHSGQNKSCTGHHWKGNVKTLCKCPGYIKKDFK